MAIFVDRKPEWLHWITPEGFDDKELYKIVIFYVFHSPCPQISSMERTLEEYGWNFPWRKPFYLNRHLRKASTNFNLIYSADSYDNLEKALKKANLLDEFPSDLHTERICIYDNKKNQFLSVFYHLRNAFAHCRLNMVDVDGECVFILEDVVCRNGKNKVSARMILRKSTLLKWIDIIESGEQKYI